MTTRHWSHKHLSVIVCIILLNSVVLIGCEASNTATQGQKNILQTATYVVAASQASNASRQLADYVSDDTDDQVQIQAAIDALPEAGGKVFLSEGTFLVRDEIHITKNNVTLEGQGHSTVLQLPDGFSADKLYMLNINASDVSILNLCLDGNRDAVEGMHAGMIIDYTTRLTIDHVWLQNFTEDGLIGTSVVLHLTNSFFYDISDDGADVNGFEYSVIANNTFKNIGDNGIDTDGAIHSSITGNTLNNCGNAGIEVEQETNPGYTEYCTVGNNTMKDCGIGILVNSGRYNSITGNTMLDCTIGIHLMSDDTYYSTHNVITGNNIQGGTYGIKEEDPNQDYNLIGLNIVEGASVANIVTSGAHTRVYK